MRRAAFHAWVLLLASCATTGGRTDVPPPDGPTTELELNGRPERVVWSDGDTFVFVEGRRQGLKARLRGVNTLETYGPVHRWGTWEPEELLELALRSAEVASKAARSCTATGERDKYDRLLVDCEDARRELLRTGHGHLYPFDRKADPAEIAIQAAAQRGRQGMWRKGIPDEIITTVRPATEENGWTAGNWLVDSKDGHSRRVGHRDEYAVCEEVCSGRPGTHRSCLLFVPYELRYGENRADCLK